MRVNNSFLRSLLIAGLIFCAVILIGCVTVLLERAPASTIQDETVLNGAGIGGKFKLVDENGKAVSEKDFNKVYKLIYFGFTFCPAICPTELQKIALAYNALPKDIQKQVQLLFVSVDPARDTPQGLKNYTAMFHSRLIGLTGNEKQIEDVKKSFKVYSAKVGDRAEDYSVDHSSFIYFMSPDDKLILIFKFEDSSDRIRDKIKAYFRGQ